LQPSFATFCRRYLKGVGVNSAFGFQLQHAGGKEDEKRGHSISRETELNNLELLLKDTSPHRECLWNGLVPNLV